MKLPEIFENPMTIVQNVKPSHLQTFVRSHRVGIYFAMTFTISWIGALAVAAPALLHNGTISKMTGLIMFPVMLLGPSLTGILLTWITDGRSGLNDLLSRMRRASLGNWYAVLLAPPSLMLIVLLCLKSFVSSVYSPNRFIIGISFGVIAGFFEEIGWMGYAFPSMCSTHRSELASAVLLGLLWGVWHLPVIDYLGTATPHRTFLIPYFLAFIGAMTAMRVLIAWTYVNTKSVLLAQLLHASSTGSLVVLSPPLVTPAQEAFWYGVYACALWVAVAIVVLGYSERLNLRRN
jgi:hypothetical protein